MEKITGIMRSGNQEGVYVWFLEALSRINLKTLKILSTEKIVTICQEVLKILTPGSNESPKVLDFALEIPFCNKRNRVF